MYVNNVVDTTPMGDDFAPEDFLPFAYKYIECDYIDAVYIDNNVTIWADEGLLKKDNVVLEYATDIILAGNLLFTGGTDNLGRNLYLDDAEIEKLKMMCRNGEVKGITHGD